MARLSRDRSDRKVEKAVPLEPVLDAMLDGVSREKVPGRLVALALRLQDALSARRRKSVN